MNPDAYKKALGLPMPAGGGQELILGEVIASIWPYQSVWLPFPEGCDTLLLRLRRLGHRVYTSDYTSAVSADVVYFGTPTIVDGKALFPQKDEWDVAKERSVVQRIVDDCERLDYKRIVCGLGSGDISLYDRMCDIHGGRVAAMKEFDVFTDWVIVRDIEEAA